MNPNKMTKAEMEEEYLSVVKSMHEFMARAQNAEDRIRTLEAERDEALEALRRIRNKPGLHPHASGIAYDVLARIESNEGGTNQ